MKLKTVGRILPNGEVEKEYYGQGFVYKNFEAFDNKSKEVCYVPELDDEDTDDRYTYEDFFHIAKEYVKRLGLSNSYEDIAQGLFDLCDWQHPETVVEGWEIEQSH